MTKLWLNADWPAPPNIHALTTLRAGGVSTGVFTALNLARHVGDQSALVLTNRRRISAMLQLPAAPVWLEQVHGTRVIQADAAEKLETADASFTHQENVVCTVMTADCLPLLLCNRQGTCVAAVHGGWRGLLAGVIENTVKSMQEGDLIAWMGPAIGPEKFAVGSEVRDVFLAKSANFSRAFQPLEKGKWLANIYALSRCILSSLNVNQVFGGEYCTYSDAQQFYSYRRDGQTGRMATFIWMES
jgi:purine-nucleoside/S-methyl-5'-thioadenosine phosphorylase / adenosine deaminase